MKDERGTESVPHQHVEGDMRRLDAPLLQRNLPEEVAALRRAGVSGSAGHVAKTLAKHADLRIVLIAFEEGGRLDRHQAPGRVCVHLLEGHVAVRLGDQSVELRAGGLLEIAPRVPHEVESLAESAMLLTIAWPQK